MNPAGTGFCSDSTAALAAHTPEQIAAGLPPLTSDERKAIASRKVESLCGNHAYHGEDWSAIELEHKVNHILGTCKLPGGVCHPENHTAVADGRDRECGVTEGSLTTYSKSRGSLLASALRVRSAGVPQVAADTSVSEIEWGVARGGNVTSCESEQSARQNQAARGGGLVYRKTWLTTWPPAKGARLPECSATPGSE